MRKLTRRVKPSAMLALSDTASATGSSRRALRPHRIQSSEPEELEGHVERLPRHLDDVRRSDSERTQRNAERARPSRRAFLRS